MTRLRPNTFLLKTPLIAAVLCLCMCVTPLFAVTQEVILVKDVEIKPYRDAIEGFKRACNCAVHELELSEDINPEELAEAHPAAIVAVGTYAFRKVKAIRTTPVIYALVIPSDTNAVSASNISGVSMDIAPESYLAAMTGMFPGAHRIGLVVDPDNTGRYAQEAESAARAKGLTLVMKTTHNPRRAPALFDELRDKVDVLWMLPDPTLINAETLDYLMLFSFQNSVPVFTFSEKYLEMGALAALTIDPYDIGVQAGEIARRLLQGEKGPLRVYARAPRLRLNRKVSVKMKVRINGDYIKNAEMVE